MPYRIQYIPNKTRKCYSVREKKTKKRGKKNRSKKPKIYSKCTTKEKAKKQIRLLRALKYNPKFRQSFTIRNK